MERKKITYVTILIIIITIILVRNTLPQINQNNVRKVTVLLVVDQNYQKSYRNWKNKSKYVLEAADDVFFSQHNIDFQVKAYGSWNSQGKNSIEILNDLNRKWNHYDYDFIVGITANKNFEKGGAAIVYKMKPNKSAVSVVLDQGNNTWKSLVHELSHNFGLDHDSKESKLACFMNYEYLYQVKTWDEKHFKQISENKKWFGTIKKKE
ncbi:zinc-dependent metalloprotease [Cytobacillus firmus]